MRLNSRGDTNSELLHVNFNVISIIFILYEKVPIFLNGQYLNSFIKSVFRIKGDNTRKTHCHGLTPASIQAPHRCLLIPQLVGWGRKSEG